LRVFGVKVIDFTASPGARLSERRPAGLQEKGVRLAAHRGGRGVGLRPESEAAIKESGTIVAAAAVYRPAALQALDRI
jgi:hypothetical protein